MSSAGLCHAKAGGAASRIGLVRAELYAEAAQRTLGDALVSVVLFGSVARGEASGSCDVDLLLVADGLASSRLERSAILDQIEDQVQPLGTAGAPLQAILFNSDEASRLRPMYFDLTEDAVLLLDRGGFFAGVLAGVRARLVRLGAVRRSLRDVRFWDLKPGLKPGEIFEI
jgi:uncharacterized protein